MMFVNNCIGDVLLTIACRFGQLGLPLGAILLTLTFIYELWGFRIIVKACSFSNSFTLLDLVNRCYSKKFALFVDVSAVLMLFAVLVCYTIIIAQYIHAAINMIFHISTCLVGEDECEAESKRLELWIKVVVGFTILPLEGAITSINVLNFISSFAIIFVFVTCVILLVRSFQTFTTKELPFDALYEMREPVVPTTPGILDIFTDFTGMFAMFSMQPCIPPLFEELPGSRNFKSIILTKASDISTIALFVLYIMVAILGCLLFYGENQPNYLCDNILVNFPPADVLMSVIRILYVVVILVGYPVVVFQVRASIASWLGIDRHSCCSKFSFIMCGEGMVVVSSIVTLFTPSILVIFDPFCATMGCVLFQLLPVLIWYKLPQLEREAEPEDVDGQELDKKVERQSIMLLAASFLGGGRQHISPQMNQRISASFIQKQIIQPVMVENVEPIGVEDSSQSEKLEGDQQQKQMQYTQEEVVKEDKKQKGRKRFFIFIVVAVIAFNSVSLGVSLMHIAQGGEE